MFAGDDMKGLQAKYKWRNGGLCRKVLGRRAGVSGRFGDGNKVLAIREKIALYLSFDLLVASTKHVAAEDLSASNVKQESQEL